MTALALPANLPSIAHAKLPATYEAAKVALAECSRIDECQNWADKMAALASYAKQSEDDELHKMADRIKARAIRRCGELLEAIRPAKNQHDANTRAGSAYVGAVSSSSRSAAAAKAGLSERQKVTALRVARVPAAEFEQAVDSDAPPTITALAERGRKPAPPAPPPKPLVDLGGRDPEHFAISTKGQGQLRSFAEFAAANDPLIVAKGAMPHEVRTIRQHIAAVDAWLDRLAVSLEG